MRKITKAAYMDYIFLFGESRSHFSDMSAKSALATGGGIFILWENDQPIGYICLSKEGDCTRLLYAYTLENMRNSGVFSTLLRYAAEHMQRPINVHITEEHSSFEAVTEACRANGFVKASSYTVFRCKQKDFFHWKEFMEDKGERLCGVLEKQGFSKVSFANMPDELISDIYQSDENEFQNELNVKPFFDDPNRCLNREMSVAVLKDGGLAAYCLVSTPDENSAVFEHISAAKKYIGSGCILLAFAGSMKLFFAAELQRAAYVMYDENESANKFRKRVIQTVTTSEKHSVKYTLY